MAQMKSKYSPLGGGLDRATPATTVKAGALIDCVNYAPDLNGGYRRMGEYERYDGRPRPSDAVYYVLEVADASVYAVGATVTGVTSGATSVIAEIDSLNQFLIITKLVGTYTDGETVSTTTVEEPEILAGAATASEEADYLYAAAEEYRADIGAVPGSGAVLGVWQHKAKTYAFRNNVGGTKAVLHKASSSGWTEVTLASYIIWFDGGTGSFAEGDVVTGGTSGASGTVHRVVEHSTGVDGYLVLTSTSGLSFTDNEALEVSAVGIAFANGVESLVDFAPDGRFDFRSKNFLGSSDTYFVYGCDGVNPAFEIDDNDVVSPIYMGGGAGAPASSVAHLIEVHKGQLFLGLANGIMTHSTLLDALEFNAFLGSAEFGLSEEITGMHSTAGGVLVIWTRRQTWGLYGNDINDWSLQSLSDEAGSVLWGAVPIERVYAWDDRGISRLDRVQSFGDFQSSTVSKKLQRVLSANIDKLVGSTVYRAQNQFWYLLNTGDVVAIHVTARGNIEFGWLKYAFTPYCVCNAADENGAERIFAGGTDGYVYELNRGTSQDGDAMRYGFRTVYDNLGSPRLRKAFKHLGIELDVDNEVTFDVSAELSYSASHTSNVSPEDVTSVGGAGFWETALWSEFYWSTQDIPTAEISLTGTGTNISVVVNAESAKAASFTIQGFLLHYIERRLDRG